MLKNNKDRKRKRKSVESGQEQSEKQSGERRK